MAINSYPEIQVDKLPTPGDDMPGVKDIIASGYITDKYTHSGTLPAGLYKMAVNNNDRIPTGAVFNFADNGKYIVLDGNTEKSIRLTTAEANFSVRSGYQIAEPPTSTTQPMGYIAYGDGRYIASFNPFTGGANVLYSDDEINWTQVDNSQLASISGVNIQNIKYLNSRFFLLAGSSKLAQSTDKGVTWATVSSVAGAETGAQFFDMAFTTGNYVVVGSFTGNFSASHSTDLVTWTTKDMGAASIDSVVFAEGLFVAVGASGMIRTSTNGVTWTQRTSGTTNRLYTVVHDGAKFYAAQNSSVLLESTDGITWSTKALPFIVDSDRLMFACATNGTAYYGVDGRDVLYYSTDASSTSWKVEAHNNYPYSVTLPGRNSSALYSVTSISIQNGKLFMMSRNESSSNYPNNSRGINYRPTNSGVEFYVYSTDLELKNN